MKITRQSSDKLRDRQMQATTLPEMIITMAVFVMSIAGLFQLHMFGMIQDQITSSKLGASDSSRVVFDRLLHEIRSAKSFRIGTNNGSVFYPAAIGQPQLGKAIRIHKSLNTNHFVLYYFMPNGGINEIRRMTNGMTTYEVITRHLNNTNAIFTAENYRGDVLTALDNHTVVSTWLEFYEFRYPKTKVGTNYYYEYYKLEFKACSRNYD